MDNLMIEDVAWVALGLGYLSLIPLWIYAWFRKPTKAESYPNRK